MRGIGTAIGLYAHGKRMILTYGVAKGDSLFEIGSVTKTFTGLILSEMALDGKVSFDTPLREILPPGSVTRPPGPEITLLDLATHHSGLPRSIDDNYHPADYTNQELYGWIAKNGVALKPDAKFVYSNLGVSLLGQGLANKSGEPFPDLLQQLVLTPLHMEHTFIHLPSAQLTELLIPHNADNKIVATAEFDADAPAGGIHSDVRDMLRYVEAQLHPPAALADAIATDHKIRADTDDGKIAISWMFSPEGDLYTHDGGTSGFTAYAFFSPKHDIAGIVLINRSSALAFSVAPQIIELLEGLPADPIQP